MAPLRRALPSGRAPPESRCESRRAPPATSSAHRTPSSCQCGVRTNRTYAASSRQPQLAMDVRHHAPGRGGCGWCTAASGRCRCPTRGLRRLGHLKRSVMLMNIHNRDSVQFDAFAPSSPLLALARHGGGCGRRGGVPHLPRFRHGRVAAAVPVRMLGFHQACAPGVPAGVAQGGSSLTRPPVSTATHPTLRTGDSTWDSAGGCLSNRWTYPVSRE